MDHSEFLKSSSRRQRYWARNYASWPIFSSFSPNFTHFTLADWEKRGKIHHHATQNVDSLLIKAGCKRLTELHGTSYKVICLDCDFKMTRDAMQILTKSLNQNWNITSGQINPDNDVFLSEEQIKTFVLPKCPKCKGDKLKPEVGNTKLFKILFQYKAKA